MGRSCLARMREGMIDVFWAMTGRNSSSLSVHYDDLLDYRGFIASSQRTFIKFEQS